MKRELKRQIKQDELISGLEAAWGWLAAHKTQVRSGAIAAVALVVILVGLQLWAQHRARAAEQDYQRATELYHAPLRDELPPETEPEGPVFDTAQERDEKALAAFDGFERRFPRHELAPRAKYYAALSRIRLDRREEAEKLLTEVAARRDLGTVEPSLALLALASLYASQEKWDEAVDTYQRLLGDESSAVPAAQVLMSLAGCLESANRLDEARRTYERLAHEFPASVYASDARSRAEYLELAG